MGKKYFTLSFDDGITQDLKIIDICKKYNFYACSFNINTGLCGANWDWVGKRYNRPDVSHIRFTEKEIKSGIYDGFDVEGHTRNHTTVKKYDDDIDTLISEIEGNAEDIFELTGKKPKGMAWASSNYSYTQTTAEKICKHTSIRFSRGASSTYNFRLPETFMNWQPTCSIIDKNLFYFADKFINAKSDEDMIFYVWGHGYELDVFNLYDDLEKLIKMMSENDDIICISNADFYELYKDKIPSVNKNKLSVFYSHIKQAAEERNCTLEEIGKAIFENGIEYIDVEIESLDRVVELCKNTGLKINCVYGFFDFLYSTDTDRAFKMIDRAKEYVTKVLVVPGYLNDEEAKNLKACKTGEEIFNFLDNSETAKNMCRVFTEVCEYGMKNGVFVTIEDFDSCKSPIERVDELLWLFEKVPLLRFNLDTGNILPSDGKAEDMPEKFLGLINNVHVKDKKEGKSQIIGQGAVNVPAVVKQLRNFNYTDALVIEHFKVEDQLSAMIASAKYIKRCLR